ncbi:hypothetical protein ACFQ07_14180, partial [Actinomadura adrarensis]
GDCPSCTRPARQAAEAVIARTNARMVELAEWAHRALTGDTLHHVLSVITNVRDLLDPDRTLSLDQPDQSAEQTREEGQHRG